MGRILVISGFVSMDKTAHVLCKKRITYPRACDKMLNYK